MINFSRLRRLRISEFRPFKWTHNHKVSQEEGTPSAAPQAALLAYRDIILNLLVMPRTMRIASIAKLIGKFQLIHRDITLMP